MNFQYVNRELVRSGFVRALRSAFETCTDFRYTYSITDPNQPGENSGIYIYDAFPWKKIGYPAIIVSLGPGNPMMRTIGGEHQIDSVTTFVSQDGVTYSNIDTERYGGGEQNTVNITVFARSSIQRSRVMDWVDIYIRYFFVSNFQREGVNIINMAHGGERQEMVGTDPVFADTLSVNVFSEFKQDVSTQLAGTVDAICLFNIFRQTPDGATG